MKNIRVAFVETFKKGSHLRWFLQYNERLLSIRSGVQASPGSPFQNQNSPYKINKLESKSTSQLQLTDYVVFCAKTRKNDLKFVDFSCSRQSQFKQTHQDKHPGGSAWLESTLRNAGGVIQGAQNSSDCWVAMRNGLTDLLLKCGELLKNSGNEIIN